MDLSSIQPLLDWLSLHQQWVALAIILIAFLESLALAGVVIPGVVLLFGASAVAGSGALSVWAALVCAFSGAVLGDCLSFFLGKKLKQRIKGLWPFRNYPDWIQNGEHFFAQHGGKSIVVGRFVGPIRPVVPLVAGMLDMSSLKFVSINLFSAIAWAPTYVLPGYLFGRSIQWGVQFPQGFNQLLLVTFGVALIVFVILRLSHGHLNPDARLYRSLQKWAHNRQDVRLFWQWLSDRRGATTEFPLPSFVLLIISSLMFASLAYLVTSTSWLAELNNGVLAYFQSLRHPWLDSSFALITLLGDRSHVRIVMGIFAAWLIFRKHYAASIICVCAVFGTEELADLLKDTFRVTRPVADPSDDWYSTSFPSGHVSRATLMFGLLASYVAQEIAYERRWWVYGLALLPVLLVAISRLYLLQHWLSDVVGGIILGLWVCAIARILFSRFNRNPLLADVSLAIASLIALTASALYISQHYPEVMAWLQA